MKFNFHVSPNIKGKQSTQHIMRDLAIGLMIIFACACAYYATAYGMEYLLQAVLLLVCSLVTTLVCEVIFAKATKQPIKPFLAHSFGWVTAIILTLMCPITITPYALIIATVFAIVVGRLLFGGFGQNIFNPAGVGRAVIFAAFTGATTDLVTSATPTALIAGDYHWLPATPEVLESFLEQFGGFGSLAMGTYAGAMGETFTIAILLVGLVLALRHVIDWRVPVVYLGGIAVMTAVIALMAGLESYNGIPAFLWYPALHLVTGGVVFGAVFMLTDPVTNPTSAAGRVLFALGAAILTVLFRMKANLPEGCLYSILLMNMFTPMIESALDGNQLKIRKKVYISFACFCLCALGVSFFAAQTIEPVTTLKTSSSATAYVVPETTEGEAAL
ncbi:RnfABCDGE type electron transport complex subunit D [uncultured Dubosiella sp.]|uniref:RnfABCDGE type electron transport complex subunit D n=1 Tax=uncultured Dubosiella sp. TaxID=1937011 RepID=UPI00272F362E|nr:RnfABCDGE type electron transport complex subunit D [uncultured Dubosiella sp.]